MSASTSAADGPPPDESRADEPIAPADDAPAAPPALDPTAIHAQEEEEAPALRVLTLGAFRVWRDGRPVPPEAWGRDKARQLFQFLVTKRRRRLEREQICALLWPDLDPEAAERDFKVALHAVLGAIEPERAPRSASRFIERLGQAYGLAPDVWLDAEALEQQVAAANRALGAGRRSVAVDRYQRAAALYGGDFLPERRYEDWSALERERLQMLALGSMTKLGTMLLQDDPLESARLAQRALTFDSTWESAWRMLMRAQAAMGNRAAALRAWEGCVAALDELGLEPLPDTRAVMEAVRGARGGSDGA